MKKHCYLLLILFACAANTAFSQLYRPVEIIEEVKYIPDNGQGYITLDSTIYLYDQKVGRIGYLRSEDLFGRKFFGEYDYYDSSVSYLGDNRYNHSQSYEYQSGRTAHYAFYTPALDVYADYHYSGKRLDSIVYNSSSTPNVFYKDYVLTYSYDAAGYIAEVNKQYYHPANGMPTTLDKTVYQYNNSGNITSVDYYDNGSYDRGLRYAYTSGNALQSSVRISSSQVATDSTHYYYNQGKCIKEEGYDLRSATLFTTRYYQHNNNGDVYLDSLVFATGEREATTTSYMPIGVYPTEIVTVQYDQSNNPMNQYERYRYKYEDYLPSSVANITTDNAKLSLFPVPATDILHLRADFTQAGKLHGSVTDMQGRVVYKWEEDAAKQYTKQIALPQLAAGSYILQVKSGDEQATKQFIKQ